MTNDISVRQKQIDFWEISLIICLVYTVIIMLAIFFEGDLFRILTPFFAPFFLLFIALGYLVLSVASFLYIPFQIRVLRWRAFIPVAVNLLTFLIAYNFYDELGNLRVDIGFRINERRFNQAANWVTQSIQIGDLDLDERSDTVILPKEYKSLADDGRVWVTNKYGVISIFFSRGGGMFEYGPGYKYRSDNAYPPIEDGDIVCVRRIKTNWYDCY
jgi:hypothetical protein